MAESTRSIDIKYGSDLVSVDLDNLDPDPSDVLEVLKEAQANVSDWTRLAAEYWKLGYLDPAERIANAAVECYKHQGAEDALSPVYALLANLQIARSREAPKMILTDPLRDDQRGSKTKDEYYSEATKYLNQVQPTARGPLAFLTRGVVQLASRSTHDAAATFDGLLAEKPNNLVALIAKGRILYGKKLYQQSLKIFQRVLRLNPRCKPDPRIGIGLCFLKMGDSARARAAWQRSLEVNPDAWQAKLLLGIDYFNAGKAAQTDEQRAAYLEGTRMVEQVFKGHNNNASAANVMAHIQQKRSALNEKLLDVTLKLAERTIQFADHKDVVHEGYMRSARVAQAQGKHSQASKAYTTSISKDVVSVLGQALIHIQNEEYPAAIHALDSFVQTMTPNAVPLEVNVVLASLRAHPRPGISSSELSADRKKAREMYDKVINNLDGPNAVNTTPTRAIMAKDTDMYAEIARLWQGEHNSDKLLKNTLAALKTRENLGDDQPSDVDARLRNNVGVLRHLNGKHDEAREHYEAALTIAVAATETVGIETTILYNLARVYEEQGDVDQAKHAYDRLLTRHPEYIDAKIRQAHLLQSTSKHNDAHLLLKQCLGSQANSSNLRAFYTHFLIHSNLPKVAKDFVNTTLKDLDKHDVYALCAAGLLQYSQARENRDTSAKGIEERKKGFFRAYEYYDKALAVDPMCAIAAQGLAILTAEDALVTLSGGSASHGAEEAQRRTKLFSEALDVFSKVRESIDDGSVYANMGHCYYSCDEFERAIEHYETASERYYRGQNASILLCLCRSWYAKANKDQMYSSMMTSLKYAQQALHIRPGDKSTLYNIATIEQKSAQMLFAIPPNKRTMSDLRQAIAQAEHAQILFASLAADKSDYVPYSKDIADQRRKFGDTLLRRKDEQLENQRSFEEESQAKRNAARQKRQDERDRVEALERARLEEKRQEAERLAEERRKAREEAQKWTQDMKVESDDEKERRGPRKPKKPRLKEEELSGDDLPMNGSTDQPKKKRKSKLKRGDGQDAAGDLFSDDDAGDRQVKKRPSKKRVVRDEEDEVPADENGPPRKKQFKSKEVLSDTDEEMDMDQQ